MIVRMPDDEAIYQPAHPPFSIPPSEPPDYLFYLPIVSSNKPNEGSAVIGALPDQEEENPLLEDPGFGINFADARFRIQSTHVKND